MTRTLLALTALLVLAGCDPAETASADGTYVGTFVGGQSGALTVTIDGETATGAVTVASARLAASATGSYDPATGAVSLSGSGYTFTGTISGTTLSGTWTGPGGTSGVYTTSVSGSGADAVAVYCGSYAGRDDDGGPVEGTLNVVIREAALTGFAASTLDGDATAIAGSVSGRDVTVWVEEDPTRTTVATGTLTADGARLDGTFRGSSDAGTWVASRCAP